MTADLQNPSVVNQPNTRPSCGQPVVPVELYRVSSSPSPSIALHRVSSSPSPSIELHRVSSSPSPSIALHRVSSSPSPSIELQRVSSTPSPVVKLTTSSQLIVDTEIQINNDSMRQNRTSTSDILSTLKQVFKIIS